MELSRETIRLFLFETVEVTEAQYPSEFNKEKFDSLIAAEKAKYLKTLLPKLGMGSSRIVFGIDPTTVIKVARSDAGKAQNETEENISRNFGYDVLAKVFDFDDKDYSWIEMERAEKFNSSDFKNYTGFSFKDFQAALMYWFYTKRKYDDRYTKPKNFDAINEKEFFKEITKFVINYGMGVGDLTRTSSWGTVTRNGQRVPVLIDFGLTGATFDKFYKTKDL